MSAAAAEAAANEAAPTREKEFVVRALLEYEYRVMAETADDAAQALRDAGRGECVGYSIDAVVSAEKASKSSFWNDEDDERAKCRCGHLFVDRHNGLWSGEPGKYPKPHPNACDDRHCGCLEAVEAEPEPVVTSALDAWNAATPVGTPVRYWTGVREGDGKTGRTRTGGRLLGGHTPVVWVTDEASCIALTHVEPLTVDVETGGA